MPLTMLRLDDPRTIGPFQLQGRLGSGGMGDVFLAFDAAGHAVALKTLPPGAGEEARTRLRREAQLLAGVRSPRVARCLGVDTASSVPWVAMEYVQAPLCTRPPSRCRIPSFGCSQQASPRHSWRCTRRASSTAT